MNDFNPGPGWREVSSDEYVARGTGHGPRVILENVGSGRFWVREDPVPPLPTAQYTVIRVTWKPDFRSTDDVKTLANGYWRGLADFSTPADLRELITSFEVLSEPRAVTAKAMRDIVRARASTGTWNLALTEVARDFGADT